MDENKMLVPDMISGNDLDYLSDMFEWNYLAYKCTNDAIRSVVDSEIKEMLERGLGLFKSNMNQVIDILSDGGNYE